MSDPKPSNLYTIKIGSQAIQLVTYYQNNAQLCLVSSPALPDKEMEDIAKLVRLRLFESGVMADAISGGDGIRMITAAPPQQKNVDNKLMFDSAVKVLGELKEYVEAKKIQMADAVSDMLLDIFIQVMAKEAAELEKLPMHAVFLGDDDEPSTQVGGVARRVPVRGLNNDYIEGLVMEELREKVRGNTVRGEDMGENRAQHIADRVMQLYESGVKLDRSKRGTEKKDKLLDNPLYLIISDELNGVPMDQITHVDRDKAIENIFEAVEKLYLEHGGPGPARSPN
ncbi:MAG: hypothetical protein SFX19_03745 [Alphaproteobacteria bacterium]|nr:hypothetical protein [Alphaproteobacteria bacterium]